MTRQEAYERMRAWFATDRRFGHDGYQCVYRDQETGARCAVGCLIPDDSPLLEYEGEGVDSLVNFTDFFDVFGDDDIKLGGFLTEAQRIHDRHADTVKTSYLAVPEDTAINHFLKDLDDLASDEGLQVVKP